MKLIKKVEKTISDYNLVETGDCLIVGVSGGADSTALLHILKQLKEKYELSLHIAHLDHKLRGEESRKDASFVEELASKLQIPITKEEVEVKRYSKQAGLSLEDAARQVRYNFFFKLKKELDFDKIAVAHHADDQVETVLMKFLRGAGLKGLGGMAPKNKKIIRPLLEVSKQEIKEYCRQNQLDFRFDSSNARSEQFRNKIRLELIPLLEEEYNSNLVSTLVHNAEIWRTEDDFMRKCGREELDDLLIVKKDNSLILDKEELLTLHFALQRRVIREAIKELMGDYKDFYRHHIEEIRNLALAGNTGSKIDLPRELVVKISYNRLIFQVGGIREKQPYFERKVSLGETEFDFLEIKIKAEVVSINYPWQKETQNDKIGFFDFCKIGQQFLVRQRCPGDRFYPLGMEGSKKIKDFLIDEKIPGQYREKIPIFTTKKEEIFWVGGLRIDERFKIKEDTEKILRIEISTL